MEPLSEAQHRTTVEGGLPAPERVIGPAAMGGGRADDRGELWSVAMPMPNADLGLGYTLSVLHIGPAGVVTLVDPGWELPEVHQQWSTVLAQLGREVTDIAHIVVTHAHPDHIGAAEELRRQSGARVYLHEYEQVSIERAREAALVEVGSDIEAAADAAAGAIAEIAAEAAAEDRVTAWGVPAEARERVVEQVRAVQRSVVVPPAADVLLREGERLPIEGFECEVLSMPGHTAGHMCLADRERGVIVTGDHVLPHIFPGLGLGLRAGSREGGNMPELERAESNPVSVYLDSLARLEPFDGFEVLPGHGYRFRGLGSRRAEMAAHVRNRAREVADALAVDPTASIWSIASQLSWSAGWPQLSHSRMLSSALLQTGYYAAYARSKAA